MHTQSLSHLLAHHAATIGDNPVFHYFAPRVMTPETLTYRELYDHACALATTLQQYDLPGKNVLLMYPPGLEFIEAFFSCMCANASAIPMYIPPGNAPDTRLRAIASTVEIAAILTVKARQGQVQKQVAELYPGKDFQVICTDEVPHINGAGFELCIDLEQPPLIQFTSGSTSKPKGVVVSHKNIIANQYMIERGFRRHTKMKVGKSMASWLPFFHDMGLIWGIMHPVFIGGNAVLMSPNDFLHNPHKWLQLISMYSTSISGAPNFAYEYCVTRIKDEHLDGVDLSSWNVAFNGSEMIRPITMKRFSGRFSPYGFQPNSMFYCYGMAETTLYVSGGTGVPGSADSPDEIACVGPPDEESEVVIVDDNTNVLPEGRTGEVWVRGPHVAQGYINNRHASKSTFEAVPESKNNGPTYLRTGDLGYMLHGNLYIVGRVKNLIIVNGKNYYGEEIEYFVARSYECFLESGACIVQTNEGLEDSEIIFMQEIKKSSIETVSANLLHLEERALQLSRQILSNFSLSVHRFIFLGASRLPRTSSGKIDRAKANKFAMGAIRNYLLEVNTR